MKKHASLNNSKLLLNKERIASLSASDMEQIIGGFQVDAHEYSTNGVGTCNMCTTLGGNTQLIQYESR